ncbi:outer membrane beta-barrel protein [Bradyrhizobium cenepequi]|uniref:outer membrane beta-barrel protein n=1 Tax=Bradyrhizobium cenepequi TaxID=2821403 RepID=UPI001CE3AF1D|nr:outer membrane beta-barrel protein [Bradyrhizobium cenepequi]MCA6109570.1 outer membrane beta-barrel protein [Bradyrhizobium cenepequi]
MSRFLLGGAVFLTLTSAASAADLGRVYEKSQPAWTWDGLYVGVHTGAMWSNFKAGDPFGRSVYGDNVGVPGYVLGGQIGYNFTVAPSWLAGVEIDGSFVESDGSNTCLQFHADFVGSNCQAKTQTMGTLAGRFGRMIGDNGHTLIYGKSGLAWSHNRVAMFGANNFFGALTQDATNTGYFAWGWTVGTGVEHAITPAWSVKFEYDYLHFGDRNVTTPQSNVIDPVTGDVTDVVARATSNIRQDAHVLKAGLNYKWGSDPRAVWPSVSPTYPVKAAPLKAWPAEPAGWSVEVGARYSFSSGRYQWDNFFVPDIAESRLTYGDMTGHSGEVFGRLDTPANVFIKGFVGAGSITSGNMHDEDWGIHDDPGAPFVGYTNTLSNPVKGPIRYGTADIGFDVLRGPDYKAGVFVGYNYFREELNAYACAQTANLASGICAPAVGPSTLVISQAATWQSLRVGYAGEAMLTDRIKIGADIAYLPYVSFDGRDDHWLRPGTFFLQSSQGGQGVQAELLLSYFVTPNLSVGIGGRYWAIWTDNGRFRCVGCDPADTEVSYNPLKGNTERYGVFVQTSYRFDMAGLAAKP